MNLRTVAVAGEKAWLIDRIKRTFLRSSQCPIEVIEAPLDVERLRQEVDDGQYILVYAHLRRQPRGQSSGLTGELPSRRISVAEILAHVVVVGDPRAGFSQQLTHLRKDILAGLVGPGSMWRPKYYGLSHPVSAPEPMITFAPAPARQLQPA